MTTQVLHDFEETDRVSALSRRGFFLTAAAVGGFALSQGATRAAIVRTDAASLPPYGNGTLPAGIRSRTVANVNGLTVHMLEAGLEESGRPALPVLHGFPELAYSWRKVMLPLAAAGYHVIAPDQRGYGRTTGWMIPMTPIPIRSARSTRCETPSGSSMRSAIGRWTPWWGTMPARPSRHG